VRPIILVAAPLYYVSRYLKEYFCSDEIRLTKADTAAFYALAACSAEMYNFPNISSYVQWQKWLNTLGLKPDINRYYSCKLKERSANIGCVRWSVKFNPFFPFCD